MTEASPDSGVPNILLVEENPGDTRLIKECCEKAQIAATLHVAKNGSEALDFLYQRGDYTDAPRPDLTILDWHLPGMSGEEVLKEIKTDSDLSSIPVLVSSGSGSEKAIETAYSHHANACVRKPADPDELMDTIYAVSDFWLDAVDLPPRLEDGEDADYDVGQMRNRDDDE